MKLHRTNGSSSFTLQSMRTVPLDPWRRERGGQRFATQWWETPIKKTNQHYTCKRFKRFWSIKWFFASKANYWDLNKWVCTFFDIALAERCLNKLYKSIYLFLLCMELVMELLSKSSQWGAKHLNVISGVLKINRIPRKAGSEPLDLIYGQQKYVSFYFNHF